MGLTCVKSPLSMERSSGPEESSLIPTAKPGELCERFKMKRVNGVFKMHILLMCLMQTVLEAHFRNEMQMQSLLYKYNGN